MSDFLRHRGGHPVLQPKSFIRVVGVLMAFLMVLQTPAVNAESQQGGQTPGQRARLTTADNARRNSQGVVTITTPTGQGSGVIVDASGIIVTNLHVVRGESKVSVALANGDTYDDVAVVDVDERKDLLLLKIKAFGLSPAIIGNSEQIQIGDRMVVIGSPRGLERTVTDGLLSAIRDTGEGYRLLQTSAPASPGSSGGGMFNEYGELVGIVTAKLSTGENLNFAVPVNYVRGLLTTDARMTLAQFAARFPRDDKEQAAPRASSTPSASPAVTADPNALASVLKNSGLNYQKRDEKYWAVTYKGKNLPSVIVLISAFENLVLSQATVARDQDLRLDQMSRILELNYTLNLAKLAVQEREVVALNETEFRTLDGAGLKAIVDAVALAADDGAGALKESTVAGITRSDLRVPITGGQTTVALLQGRSRIRFDANQWRLDKSNSDSGGIYQYTHSSNGVYFRVISERIEIPIEKISEIAVSNMQAADANAKITQRGWRQVNGLKMLFQEVEATVDGIPVVFYGHYYSDASGTVQLLGWTGRSLLSEYRATIERFVSGFELVR